ncbi:MAG: phosphomannomutase/phosphoglucomutase [Candidatus Portiera sp.]|nr:phosphomannomutase/phosphoglucomutase [Portiera sp.]
MNKQQQIPKDVFRAYDIRGILDEQLTPELFTLLGKSYAQEMHKKGLSSIIIGRDGRLSSPSLSKGLIDGLVASAIDVIDIGMVPTPCLYFAVSKLQADAGIMITGSHNPKNYNGCKMLLDTESVALDGIEQLYHNIVNENFPTDTIVGKMRQEDFLPIYLEALTAGIKLSREYHIVVDSGNGVTGMCAPQLYRNLGCKVTELYCEVDGNFPNHHPDPGNPKNLVEIQAKVRELNADAGLAFDGDGDRLGLITNQGEITFPDRFLMLLVEDLLSRHPGTPIIYDVKCSSLLAKVIKENGGEPVMWNTGHSLIKRKMQETGALLAGEMSGHIFFAENWPKSDDALLAGVKLLNIMDKKQSDLSGLLSAYPDRISTPEINLHTTEKEKFVVIDKIRENKDKFAAQEVIEIDGVRAEYADGWGLVRASNTSPVLVLRFEADNNAALNRIIDSFIIQLSAAAPQLDLTNLEASKL